MIEIHCRNSAMSPYCPKTLNQLASWSQSENRQTGLMRLSPIQSETQAGQSASFRFEPGRSAHTSQPVCVLLPSVSGTRKQALQPPPLAATYLSVEVVTF